MQGDDDTPDDDLWFLPGPLDDEPGPPALSADEGALLVAWSRAEAAQAARLARVAGRLGALDERLRRGPEGWRHRLALIEAADLSWFAGDRIPADRLALWIALRISSVQDDGRGLARAGWAMRRLTGGPGPDAGLAAFLGRHAGAEAPPEDGFADRAEGWRQQLEAGEALHPITRAAMGFHLWSLAGLGPQGDPLEPAVTAARIAAAEGGGAVFAPLAMGGSGGLRATGEPASRLARWLDGMDTAILAAMRQLDRIEDWTARAAAAMAGLSGRTPARLRAVLADWPLVSAPMAEALTGASRAAVQRNLAWMETRGLVREVTGQGRYRFWRAAE